MDKNASEENINDLSYGGALNYWRKKANITKKGLAEKLDISVYDIYCFEENLKHPNKEQKQKINFFFGIDLESGNTYIYEETQNIIKEEEKPKSITSTSYLENLKNINIINYIIMIAGALVPFLFSLIATKNIGATIMAVFWGFAGMFMLVTGIKSVGNINTGINIEAGEEIKYDDDDEYE